MRLRLETIGTKGTEPWRSMTRLAAGRHRLAPGFYKAELGMSGNAYVTLVLTPEDPILAPLYLPLDPAATGGRYQKRFAIGRPYAVTEVWIECPPGASRWGEIVVARLSGYELLAGGWRKALRSLTSPSMSLRKLRQVFSRRGDLVFSPHSTASECCEAIYTAWQKAFEGPAEAQCVNRQARPPSTCRPGRVLVICDLDSPDAPTLLETYEHLARCLPPGDARLLMLGSLSSPPARFTGSTLDQSGFQFVRSNPLEWGGLIRNEISNVQAEIVIVLERAGRFHSLAIPMILAELRSHSQAVAVYADHDYIDGAGRRIRPFFKPKWSPEYLRAYNYIGQAVAFRADASVFGGPAVGITSYQRLLHLTAGEHGDRVRHIPRILFHETMDVGGTDGDLGSRANPEHAVAATVLSEVAPGAVPERIGGLPARRVCYALVNPRPLVSAIIPSKDNPKLLKCAVQAVLDSDYGNVEVVIVDNGSTGVEQNSLLVELARNDAVRVLRDPQPFNFSQLINRGRAKCRGEVLLLLNDDVESTEPTWLAGLVSLADRPAIGCVGALLLYADCSVQHAGVLLGINGTAGHAFRHCREDLQEIGLRLQVVHEVCAVTAACLAVRATVFDSVGGFDEDMPVTMNDVDFCLRVMAGGHRNLFSPHVRLFHREAATRGLDITSDKLQRLARERGKVFKRWGERLLEDDYYSPHLSRSHEDFRLRGI